MTLSRIQRISCETGLADDFSMLRLGSSSGARWSGMCVEQMSADGPVLVPESFLRRHLVTVAKSVSTVRWQDGPTAELLGDSEAVCVFPALRPFQASSETAVSCTLLEFEPRLIDEAARRIGAAAPLELRAGLTEDTELFVTLARALVDLSSRDDPASAMLAESLGATFAMHLVQTCSTGGAAQPEPRSSLAPAKIRLVEEFVDANLHTSISLTSLANLVGMSIFHFARCFRQSVGEAPHRYLTRRRIERARQLLANPTLGVADVALRCGFSNQSHFSETFRRNVGSSPREYRVGLIPGGPLSAGR
jgi:AraC-like DNA-binding protein